MVGRQRPLLKKEAPAKLVSLSFCGPAAATLRRRLAWSASSLHGRPQPAPPRGQAPALPRPGCLFVLGPQGPWTAQRPQTSHTQGSGRFLFFLLAARWGPSGPAPPRPCRGVECLPVCSGQAKGKVVPLRGLHLAFCLASHGPFNGSWLGAGPAAAATAGARHPRPLPHSASGKAGVPRYPPCRALVGSWPLS